MKLHERDEVNTAQRRRLLGFAAAAPWMMAGGAMAQAGKAGTDEAVPGLPQRKRDSFGPLKQVDAGALRVGYAEVGPVSGQPVLLLHGWPYDIHTYVDVAPILAAQGYRVIVPFVRGYGTTRFISDSAPRNGQQSAVAADAIALMDALHIDQAVIGGCDWGARTANIIAAVWPQRCKAHVSVSGYL